MLLSWEEIRGQEAAKRALEIAVGGDHPILLIGPPGCGKTVLLRAAAHLVNRTTIEGYERRPCPCGWFGSEVVPCGCTPEELGRHQREEPRSVVAMRIRMAAVPARELLDPWRGEPADPVRERIRRAEAAQRGRGTRNHVLTPSQLQHHAAPGEGGAALLRAAIQRRGLSAAQFFDTLRVGRTIADLDASDEVNSVHLAEALVYQGLQDG